MFSLVATGPESSRKFAKRMPLAVCDLRATPAVRAAATVQPGRGGRGRGRVAADRGADPAALAAGAGAATS